MRSPIAVVDENFAAYNARDLDTFMRSFDPDIELVDLRSGEVTARGLAAVRERYGVLFVESPALCARILHRIAVGDLVCDHELVRGRAGGDVEILITYQIRAERIVRISAARVPVGGLHIVTALPIDRDAIAALGRATYAEHFASLWSPDALERYLETHYAPAVVEAELASGDATYLLAAGSELEGFAKLRGAELQKLYVRGRALGRGVGSRLLAAAIDHVRAEGHPAIWLDVLDDNAGAIRLYRRHGFDKVSEAPFTAALRPQAMWRMVKPLVTAAGTPG